MSIKDDKDEFNNTCLRGVLRKAMECSDEAFIKELPGGWRGELLTKRPPEGTGPYLHFQRGAGVLRYSNEYVGDNRVIPFRVER